MASKKDQVPPIAQAVIAQCELCDRNAEARYFCEDCQEDMCKQCKTTHQRSKSGRNHNVISTAMEVKEEKAVSCISHPHETIQMYCNDCKAPVCFTCISNKEHPNHALVKIADAVDKYRKELLKCVSDTKQEISELEGTLKTVSNNKIEYETQHNVTIDGINKRRKKLKSQVDKTADNLIKEAKKHKNGDIKELEKHGDNINKIISEKQEQVQLCEKMLQTERGFPIIQLSAEFKQKQNKGPSRNISRHVIPAPRFVWDNFKDINISGIFGGLELESKGNDQATSLSESHDSQSKMNTKSGNKDQPKVASTTIDTTTVAVINPGITSYCVSPANDKEAWVAYGLGIDSDIALININGGVKKRQKMDFTIRDIALTSVGDVLLTDWDGESIKKYTKEGQCANVIDTSPSYPYGISITSLNDILVCLHGSDGPRVVRMTTKGQVKQTIKQDRDNKDLFTFPYLITENINGDVCVVDSFDAVVVVNKEGIARFRYPDIINSSNAIGKCFGITCDSFGYILINDHGNHQIHQINRDGSFIQYILTGQHGIQHPQGLSIDITGKLWVCNEDGKAVKVVKYRSY